MFLMTFLLYALSPQLKSLSWIPDAFLAVRLNNLLGRVFPLLLAHGLRAGETAWLLGSDGRGDRPGRDA